jgi:membrane-associated PAP2 superfamily phosphatase
MDKKSFYFSMAALGIAAAVLCFVGRYTDTDLWLANWMYDEASRDFPLRENWFAATFAHEWMRNGFITIAVSLIALLAVDKLFSLTLWQPAVRIRLAGVAAASVLVPLVISLLKSRSMHHCPWDIDRFGGTAPYLRLFDHLPMGVAAGHCFPAGHASSALWLGAIALFWLPRHPRKAAWMGALGMVPGLSLGWMQQLRGAHFLTHTLWSAWIAALVVVLIARILYDPLRVHGSH